VPNIEPEARSMAFRVPSHRNPDAIDGIYFEADGFPEPMGGTFNAIDGTFKPGDGLKSAGQGARNAIDGIPKAIPWRSEPDHWPSM